MSTDTPSQPTDEDEPTMQAAIEELQEEVAALKAERDDPKKKMTIIATKGTLDMAYPPLILASTAAAFDWEVTIFHTFWGLDILHEKKSKNLKLSTVGNPSMGVPNVIGALPGMDAMATRMMSKRMDENGTATIQELIDLSLDQGVELQACQMTADMMEYEDDDFFEGVTTGVGAAAALADMAEADIQLLV